MTETVLYHRTTIGQARVIATEGFQDDKWSFISHDPYAERDHIRLVGVWLTDRPLTRDEGPEGDAVVEVTVRMGEDALSDYEVSGVLDDARLWVVPASVLNPRSHTRILEVDPRTSWWYEAQDGE